MVIKYFYEVPTRKWFRWRNKFWQRVGQNMGMSNGGSCVMIDTVELVAIREKDLKNEK